MGLKELLKSYADETGGVVLGIDIVQISTGMPIASWKGNAEFNPEATSASYAEVIKQNRKACELLGLGKTDQIVIVTDKAWIILSELGEDFYWEKVTKKEANIGLLRVIANKYIPKFIEELKKIGGK